MTLLCSSDIPLDVTLTEEFDHVLCIKGFFVVRLQQSNETSEIKDPDPLINCDLMDGRDAFLTLSRDKHFEFSSLRRAKYSTMGLLYELHTQAKDGFIYTCNDCKANVETRYHCVICEVSSCPVSLITRITFSIGELTSNSVAV